MRQSKDSTPTCSTSAYRHSFLQVSSIPKFLADVYDLQTTPSATSLALARAANAPERAHSNKNNTERFMSPKGQVRTTPDHAPNLHIDQNKFNYVRRKYTNI